MALPSYDIDFEKLIKQLLPALYRRVKRIAWLKAALIILKNIHTSFVSYSQGIVDEIKWNGQTIKLQNLLIEQFGAGITITNNEKSLDGLFVGAGSDASSFIGTGGDVSQFIDVSYQVSLFDFTVSVPGAISFDQTEMEGYINKYKRYGTTYNIVIV